MTLSISTQPKFFGLIPKNFLFFIKEQVYPNLVAIFYSNLSFQGNVIHSHVKNVDINISLEIFASILHLPCKGANIFSFDLDDFQYPDGETPLTISLLLHDDDNPVLVKNEEVKYYTITAQVLTQIVFYNLLSKSSEFSHAMGCAPLLIYCLM